MKKASDAEVEEEHDAKEALAHAIRLRCTVIGPLFGERIPGLGLSRDRLEDILEDIPGDILELSQDRQTYDFLLRVLAWLECDVEIVVTFRPQPEFEYGSTVDPLRFPDPAALRGRIKVAQKSRGGHGRYLAWFPIHQRNLLADVHIQQCVYSVGEQTFRKFRLRGGTRW